MTTTATRNTQAKTSEGPLFMSFELSEKTWKLGFTTGPGQKPRERNVTARDQERVLEEIAQAKRRLGLPDTAPVVRCYEAGREGFWLHRFLQAQGLTNQVVDASSIMELAGSWRRYQPESALRWWFRERFGGGGKRVRRIGIVAVARKLLSALWRFLETGSLPAGTAHKERCDKAVIAFVQSTPVAGWSL